MHRDARIRDQLIKTIQNMGLYLILGLENFLNFFLGTKCTYVCMVVSKFFKSITTLGEPRIRTQLVETSRNMGLYVMRGQGEVCQSVVELPNIYYS